MTLKLRSVNVLSETVANASDQIWGFRRDVDEDFEFLGCEAASWNVWLLNVRPSCCFRNVGSHLPSYSL